MSEEFVVYGFHVDARAGTGKNGTFRRYCS